MADPTHGMIFHYDKPAASNRCENHGIRVDGVPYVFQNNAVYYLGWWSKISSTANNNANFQWKSFENHIQNFPIVLKMIGGQMTLMYTPPGGGSSFLWRQAIMANTWHHYVLGIKTSDAIRGGTIEFWFDGVKQTLSGSDSFAGRTFDSKNCPKWGVYGGRGTAMSNSVADLRIGTTYEDVAMGSPQPTPPAGPPTDAGNALPDAGASSPDAATGGEGPLADAAAPGGVSGGGAGGAGGGSAPPAGPATSTGGSGGQAPVAPTPPAGEGAGSSPPPPVPVPAPAPSSGGCQMSGGQLAGSGHWLVPVGLLALAGGRRIRTRRLRPPVLPAHLTS